MGDTQESFFELLPHIVDIGVDEEGVIEYSGTRFEYFRTEMFSELFDAMEEVAGPEIEDKISDFGVKAGQDIAERMDDEFKDTSLVEMLKLLVKSRFNIRAILNIAPTDDASQWEKIAAYGKYVGWVSDLDTVELDAEEKYFETKLYDCFEAKSYGETGQDECSFLPGVSKGIMAYFWDVEPEELVQKEEECVSAGDDFCRVVVHKK